MTKPVQIQRFNIVSDKEGWTHHENSEIGPYCLFADADAREQAALLQVRSLLEAKAKEWRDEAQREYDSAMELGRMGSKESAMRINARSRTRENLSDELLALAATLGNQGK